MELRSSEEEHKLPRVQQGLQNRPLPPVTTLRERGLPFSLVSAQGNHPLKSIKVPEETAGIPHHSLLPSALEDYTDMELIL